ncbi:MAG: type IV secretory system conjugative DNA transfer family protein [Candidatus Obscuribacterales bacterium]|nr:type IV secretory system conjugative DNA transfer family protein [Candidatus Obscuribacterales bacterium]
MGEITRRFEIKAAPIAVPNILVTVLAELGWNQIFFNEHLTSVSARLSKTETVMNCPWEYEFALTVSWNGSECGSTLAVQLRETRWNWTDPDCDKFAHELIEKVLQCALAPESLRTSTGATLGTIDDLIKAGFVDSYAGPENFILTKINGLYVRVPRMYSVRHISIEGATGTGKTSALFCKNLTDEATLESSAIVTEATGSKGRADLFCKTSGWRKAHGQEVFYINPSELRSHRLNILDLCSTYDDVLNVVEILMRSTNLGTHKGDQFWEQAERLLLTALILHSFEERNSGNCHIGFVLDLLGKGAAQLAPLLGRSEVALAAKLYESFIENSAENQRASIAAGLLSRLSIWNAPRIRELTRTTDLDFESLQEKLFTWYIAVQADRFELKPIAALMFNSVFLVIRKYKFAQPIKILADELPNMGRINDLAQRLTILRHDGISLTFGCQDYKQLENVYGSEAPLFSSQPAIRIIFPPNDLAAAERTSRALGMKEERITSVTSGGQLIEKIERRPVMPPEELTQMKPGEILVFTPVAPPVKLQALSWRDYGEETDETQYPPPYPAPLDVDESLICTRQNIEPEAAPDPDDDLFGDIAC